MHPLLRFTLDLFDAAPLTPEAPNLRTVRTRRGRSSGTAGPDRAIPAPELVRPDPAASGDLQLIQPAAPVQLQFRHPLANRQLLLGPAIVGFAFRRSRRRTIGFVVSADGLAVSAPNWVPLHEVDSAVREKAAWILGKLAAARDRQTRLQATRVEWRDGATVPFLGQPVVVLLDPQHQSRAGGAVLHALAPGAPGGSAADAGLTLRVALRHDADAGQIRDAVQAWLMRQAKRVFTERLDHYAGPLQVRWRRLSLSSAGTRWGSASADGSIRLNWRLIHFRQDVIDYVVAHELSHLRVMDHSPQFWDTVRSVVPDYAELRGQLKEEALPNWSTR